MFNQFDKSTFTSYFIIILFFTGILYRFWSFDVSYNSQSNLYLNKWSIITPFGIVIAFISIRINSVISSLKIFSKNNNLTLYLFLFFTTLWLVNKPKLSDLLILVQSYYCIEIFNSSLTKKSTIENFFKLGILTSTILLIVKVNIIYLLPILISFSIVGKNSFKDFLSFLIGFIIPIYCLSAYTLFTENHQLLTDIFYSYKNTTVEIISGYDIYVISLIIFTTIISLPKVSSLNINTRMLMSSIFPLLISLVLFSLFFSYKNSKILSGLTIISAIYGSIFINYIRNKKQKNILIILTIILGIINIFVL